MNIAIALKSEIARVSRKEIKNEIQQIRKSSVQYRADIAALKRRVLELERLVGRMEKGRSNKPVPLANDGEGETRQRFSAKGFAAHRKRLGLSAADMGKLLGVSGASVHMWEWGKTRPRASMLPQIATLREIGKKQAAESLASLG